MIYEWGGGGVWEGIQQRQPKRQEMTTTAQHISKAHDEAINDYTGAITHL